MQTCSHCEQPLSPNDPYCGACGQPRMLESLLAPRARPDWQVAFWNAVAVVGVLCFLVSSSVAFLREAKAVRVSRQALAAHTTPLNQMADQILSGFLQDHPDHEQALLLAATAAARIEALDKTAELRGRLEAEEPELLAELDSEINGAIDSSIAAKGCGPSALLSYYDATEPLGETFRPRVLTDVQEAVRRCQTSNHEREAYAVMVGMVERGVGASLIEETYLEPLRSALTAGRYREAESLARGALQISPETEAAVDEALTEVRGRVESSFRHVDEACQAVRTAPGNRVGRFWCFPEEPPTSVTSVRDGWGRQLYYSPLQFDPNLQCYQGFEVASYGADGQETPEVTGRPDGDLVCRFIQGRTTTQEPTPFWRTQG